MSIIHDALKRAQNEFKKKEKENPNTENSTTPEIYNKLRSKTTPPIKSAEHEELQQPPQTQSEVEKTHKKKLNITFISLIAVFSLFIGVFISFLIVLLNQSPTRESTDEAKPAKSSSKKSTKRKSSIQKNELLLSGTMMMGEKRVALINGEIYELGESVRGKKITDVTLKNVELTDETGAKTSLSVRRN